MSDKHTITALQRTVAQQEVALSEERAAHLATRQELSMALAERAHVRAKAEQLRETVRKREQEHLAACAEADEYRAKAERLRESYADEGLEVAQEVSELRTEVARLTRERELRDRDHETEVVKLRMALDRPREERDALKVEVAQLLAEVEKLKTKRDEARADRDRVAKTLSIVLGVSVEHARNLPEKCSLSQMLPLQRAERAEADAARLREALREALAYVASYAPDQRALEQRLRAALAGSPVETRRALAERVREACKAAATKYAPKERSWHDGAQAVGQFDGAEMAAQAIEELDLGALLGEP